MWFFSCSVGNKDDNVERKVVQPADARRLADQIGVPFIETSAKENKNVEEVNCTFDDSFITLCH
jgi:Ras-related protein Rab-1A